MGFSFKKTLKKVGGAIEGAVKGAGEAAVAPIKAVGQVATGDVKGAGDTLKQGFQGGMQAATGMSGAPVIQALPPTGLQRQVAGMQQTTKPPLQIDSAQQQLPTAQTSLSQLSNALAQSYGLPIGRNPYFDDQGNALQTPDQIAAQTGQGVGDVSAKMQLIGDAIQRRQQEQQMKKSEAALQSGIGLVNSRGRGSLATLQSGLYQNLAQLYQNQQYEAADFSLFAQNDMFKQTMELEKEKVRLAKKGAKSSGIGGILEMAAGIGSMFIPGVGAAVGAPLLAGGASKAAGSGWFVLLFSLALIGGV